LTERQILARQVGPTKAVPRLPDQDLTQPGDPLPAVDRFDTKHTVVALFIAFKNALSDLTQNAARV
jgi:hypothetical protein